MNKNVGESKMHSSLILITSLLGAVLCRCAVLALLAVVLPLAVRALREDADHHHAAKRHREASDADRLGSLGRVEKREHEDQEAAHDQEEEEVLEPRGEFVALVGGCGEAVKHVILL